MWRKITQDLPEDLAKVTTSIWDYQGYGQVGVMRSSFLSPPLLWFQLQKVEMGMLKKAPKLLSELQLLLEAPLVLAEAKLDAPRSQRFLTFLGFAEKLEASDRKLYSRSI